MEPNGRGRPASRKQLAYIKQLRTEIGDVDPEVDFDLSSAEASQLIGKLMGRLGGNGLSTGNGYSGHIGRINEPRLGMAMKECFRLTAGHGWDVYGDYRKYFIEKVIKTYLLFTEIAERVEKEAREGIQVQANPQLVSHALEPGVEEVQVA